MKKTLLFAAAALTMLASCSQSDDLNNAPVVAESQNNAIEFGTYVGKGTGTRTTNGTPGSITTTSLQTGAHKDAGFGVFAYYTGTNNYTYSAVTTTGATGQTSVKPNFMYNQQVKWNDGLSASYVTKWQYSPLKYWPNEVASGAVDNQTGAATTDYTHGGNVSFFAYAPYVSSASGDDGITGMTAASAQSDPILTYSVAAAGNDVVDLLWGTAGSASANVVGGANSGVTYNSTGSEYQQSILPNKATSPDGYTLNADLTKQKTNGKVDFAFKHALAKVGGSTTTGVVTPNGLLIQLDLDNQQGALNGGTKEAATLVTVKSITISAKAKSAAAGDDKYYQTKQTGTFNLANGYWNITSTQGTAAAAATTTHIINQSGTGTNVAGTLDADIAENAITYSSGWKANGNAIAGVTETAKNVYSTEAAPLVFIPGTYPELTVTVDYFVRTYDEKLDGNFSEVEQNITKTITFAEAVKLNKQYNLLIHLGLTSVKFTATVNDWDPDVDGDGTVEPTGDDATDVHVPINVN